jgi:type II secretory pathway pseudopilin PulG
MTNQGAGSGERYPPWQGELSLAAFTLVEALVVIALLGLIFGVSGLAFSSLRLPHESTRITALKTARAAAIRTGRPVRAVLPGDSGGYRSPLPAPLFLPDGRALGPAAEPLTGTPVNAPK